MAEKKKLFDISWNVSEEEYRADKALSYSILAKYERTGFNGLDTLFDKVETPSLTFGSAVDAIITGGQEEFDSKFMVATFPVIPDSIVKMVKLLFSAHKDRYSNLTEIPNDDIIYLTQEENYQLNWKPDTRAKVIKEKGFEYYRLLFNAGDRTILDNNTYGEVLQSVRALKESEATSKYFAQDNPFDSIERYYQLKFKGTFNGIEYRNMVDCLYIDHANKTIIPIDLKTSSKPEWDFYKSFIEWNYSTQARLYWAIIRQNMDKDDYYKDFKLCNYLFIVVNRKTLTPLVWEYEDTTAEGTLYYGKHKDIICRSPFEIGEELTSYLNNSYKVPIGINECEPNKLNVWLERL